MKTKRKRKSTHRRGVPTLVTTNWFWTIEAKGRWILSRRRRWQAEKLQRVGTFEELELAQCAAMILAMLEGEKSVGDWIE